jgi:outer membrane protein assembly factor BamB
MELRLAFSVEEQPMMRNCLTCLVSVFSLFLLAACSSSAATTTPAPRATPAPAPVTLFYSTYDPASSQESLTALDGANGKPRWTYTTSATPVDMPVLLGEGAVYLATSTSLIALDASTGSVHWNNSALADAGIVGSDTGVLIVRFFSSDPSSGAPTRTLDAINASDGSVRWHYQFHNGDGHLLANGVIYGADILTPFGTPTSPTGSMVLAINASDGSVKWQSTPESGYLTPLSVAQGLLFADNSFSSGGPESIEAFSSGGPESIEAYHVSDGSLAWKYPGDTGLATYVGMDNNILYALHYGGDNTSLVALNVSTGTVIWQEQEQPRWQTFVAPGMVLVGDGPDDVLTALNGMDGKQLWQAPLGTPSGDASALVTVGAVSGGIIYLTTPERVIALNAGTGSVKWKAQDSRAQNILAVRNGLVYSAGFPITSSSTFVAARSVSTGATLWSDDVMTPSWNLPIVG